MNYMKIYLLLESLVTTLKILEQQHCHCIHLRSEWGKNTTLYWRGIRHSVPGENLQSSKEFWKEDDRWWRALGELVFESLQCDECKPMPTKQRSMYKKGKIRKANTLAFTYARQRHSPLRLKATWSNILRHLSYLLYVWQECTGKVLMARSQRNFEVP